MFRRSSAVAVAGRKRTPRNASGISAGITSALNTSAASTALRGLDSCITFNAAIDGIAAAEATGAVVFQAGTKEADGRLVASGGRVLAVTASGPDVKSAQAAAYRAVDAIDFPDGFCRRDIGWREVAREKEQG